MGTEILSRTERREEEGRKKKEQVIVEQDAEQRAGGVLDISEHLKPIRSEGVGLEAPLLTMQLLCPWGTGRSVEGSWPLPHQLSSRDN